MTEAEALSKMVYPGMRRSMVWLGGILQVWIGRACDLACVGCEQNSQLAGKPGMITPDQYDAALRSLKGYWGVVGMHGGNPTIHPQFPLLCEILRSHFPQEQCGLFSNSLHGHGSICRQTFNPNHGNINVHGHKKAADEFRRDWPEAIIRGEDTDSRHSPPLTAMQDLIPDEGERWELISKCSINQCWSAYICVVRGQLRGFFCEQAASMTMLHQDDKSDAGEYIWPDTGLEVVPGWWDRPGPDFYAQVRLNCHACGIPMNSFGNMSQDPDGVEQVTRTHYAHVRPKNKGRRVQLVMAREELREQAMPSQGVVDYIGNAINAR